MTKNRKTQEIIYIKENTNSPIINGEISGDITISIIKVEQTQVSQSQKTQEIITGDNYEK